MWVDGWNFVRMTDGQMVEWSGGSVCVGMTDGWMDGWMVEQIVAVRWTEKREWMDVSGWTEWGGVLGVRKG
jgi:hypothetical protein